MRKIVRELGIAALLIFVAGSAEAGDRNHPTSCRPHYEVKCYAGGAYCQCEAKRVRIWCKGPEGSYVYGAVEGEVRCPPGATRER